MAMDTGGSKGSLKADINVTPLVDVRLVLLIIFMVTAPMLQTGVDLDLPQAEAKPVPDDEGKLILSLDRTGKVFLGETPVAWDDLEAKLKTNAKVQADHTLYVDADKNLPYGQVLQVMAIAQKAEVTKLLMMTDPSSTGAPDKPPAPGDKAAKPTDPTAPPVR
jgi:biopolymer transport protein TolR